MNAIYRLEDAVVGPLSRMLGGAAIPTLVRFTFLATLAVWFWKSAMTKLGEGIGGLFSPSTGAYIQILPKQMEAAGYDPSALGFMAKLIVIAGTWGEFIIPALIVLGLFTRASALAMIVFILVLSYVDITGHGAAAETKLRRGSVIMDTAGTGVGGPVDTCPEWSANDLLLCHDSPDHLCAELSPSPDHIGTAARSQPRRR